MSETKQLALQENQMVAEQPKEPAERNVYAVLLSKINDPDTDPARLREFLALAKEMEADHAYRLWVRAFQGAKREMDGIRITKNGKIVYTNKPGTVRYAKYDDIAKEIKPILSKHDLTESFSYRTTENQTKVICVMKLTHAAGHFELFDSVPLPLVDASGGKNDVQGAGSVASYGKRFAIVPAFDIVVEDEDDDGSGQGVQPLITDEQAADIRAAIMQIDERQPGAAARFREYLLAAHKTDDIDQLHQGPQLDSVKRKIRSTLKEAKRQNLENAK